MGTHAGSYFDNSTDKMSYIQLGGLCIEKDLVRAKGKCRQQYKYVYGMIDPF
jgi:hypothetical protein